MPTRMVGSVGLVWIKKRCNNLPTANAPASPTPMPNAHRQRGPPDEEPDDGAGARTESHTNANFLRSLDDGKRGHGIEPDRSQQQARRTQKLSTSPRTPGAPISTASWPGRVA